MRAKRCARVTCFGSLLFSMGCILGPMFENGNAEMLDGISDDV